MALTSAGFLLTVTLKDSAGDASVMRFELTAANAAAATTDAAAILPLLQALTDGVVAGYSISERFIEGAFAHPAGGVEVENRAVVVCQITNKPGKTTNLVIPAAKSEIFVSTVGPQRNSVNTTNAALLAYATIFGAAGKATVSDGETISQPLISGRRIHRGGVG